MDHFTVFTVFMALLGLALGGAVKGLLGIGLPMISIPFLVTFISVPDALAIMYAPVLVANLWQALRGGQLTVMVRRFRYLFLFMPFGIWAGTYFLVSINERTILGVVGIIVVVLSAISLLQPHFALRQKFEKPLSLIVGLVSGTLLAIALHMGPLLALYFASLNIKKDEFVRALSLTSSIGILFIGGFYIFYGVLKPQHIPFTLIALLPVMLTTWLGEKCRGRINESTFRKWLFILLILIGGNLIRKAMM